MQFTNNLCKIKERKKTIELKSDKSLLFKMSTTKNKINSSFQRKIANFIQKSQLNPQFLRNPH